VQDSGNGTFFRAHFTTAVVAVLKNVVGAEVAQHLDAGKAGDLFGSIAPEDNFFLQIDYADANLQAIEYVAVDVGILEGRHGEWARLLLTYPSAGRGQNFRSAGCRGRGM